MHGSDPTPDVPPARAPAPRVAVVPLAFAAALLAHAAATHAGVFDLPAWLPIVQCLVASVIGLRELRRLQEGEAEASEPAAGPERTPEPLPAMRAGSAPPIPARVGGPLERTGGSAPGP
jgi:hypothetical protein